MRLTRFSRSRPYGCPLSFRRSTNRPQLPQHCAPAHSPAFQHMRASQQRPGSAPIRAPAVTAECPGPTLSVEGAYGWVPARAINRAELGSRAVT